MAGEVSKDLTMRVPVSYTHLDVYKRQGRQATPEPVQPAATESSADDKELLLKLLQNPEMAALLKSLAKTL